MSTMSLNRLRNEHVMNLEEYCPAVSRRFNILIKFGSHVSYIKNDNEFVKRVLFLKSSICEFAKKVLPAPKIMYLWMIFFEFNRI